MKYTVICHEVYPCTNDGWVNGHCVASCTSKEAAEAAARLFNESYSVQQSPRNHPAFERAWAAFYNGES